MAPGDVATKLATRASLYKGKTYQPPGNARPRQTKEGASAVKDAIQWLQKCEAACPLAEAGVGLKLAAEDHAVDVGGAGVASHRGRGAVPGFAVFTSAMLPQTQYTPADAP